MLWGSSLRRNQRGGKYHLNQTFTFHKLPGCKRIDCFAFVWQTGKEIRRHVAVQGETSANDTSDAQRSSQSKHQPPHGQHPLLRRSALSWHPLLHEPPIQRHALLRRHPLLLWLDRTQSGAMAYPRSITRTRIRAAIRTVVTTTTRTTLQHKAITYQWLRPYSGALANSVVTAA